MSKDTYINPKQGTPLLSTISKGITPIIEIKFCNLLNPFYYPNSPKIPRYSVTCVIDPEENREFLEGIQTIEKNEKVESSIIKFEDIKRDGEYIRTGNCIIKFQGKDLIPIFLVENEKHMPMKLADEFAKGEKISISYDILRYTKKNTAKVEHGLSFKPTQIFFYPKG